MIHAINGTLNVFSYKGTTVGEDAWSNTGSLAPMTGSDGCAGPDVGRFILSGRIRCPDGQCDNKYAARSLRTKEILAMIPSADDDSKFIFAGHSMGGAVSQIAALHGCAIQTPEQSRTRNTYNLTFGAPGVFSSDVAEKFNAIFPGNSAMRVEIKGDPVTAFGSRSKAGMRFELDGDPFPAGALAERGPFGDLAAGHPAHTYVRNFPSIL